MARTIHSNSATARTTTTSSTPADKVALTFTPDASSDYCILGSAVVDCAQVNSGMQSQMVHDTASVTLAARDMRGRDVTDFQSMPLVSVVTFGASPPSQTFSIKYSAGNAVVTGIQQAYLTSFKLGANDEFVKVTSFATSLGTRQTAATLSFTPPSSGDYVIIASAGVQSGTEDVCAIDLFDGTTAYAVGDKFAHRNSASAKAAWGACIYAPSLSGAQTWTVRFNSNGSVSGTAYDLCIVALRVSDWPAVFHAENQARTTTTSTSYQDRVTLTQTLEAGDHVLLYTSMGDHTSNAQQTRQQITYDGSALLVEDSRELNTASTSECTIARWILRTGLTEASHTWVTQYRAVAGTSGISYSNVVVLQPFDSAAGTVDGDGTAAGAGAATAVGAVQLAGAGAAAGAGVASAVGAVTLAGAGAAAGTGTGTGTGSAQVIASGVGAAAGAGAATGTGAPRSAGVGTAAGDGAATGAGIVRLAVVGSAAGAGTTTAVGGIVLSRAGAADGTGVASAVGVARFVAAGAGTAAGDGAATAVGSIAAAGGEGTAAGVGTGSAVGLSTGAGVGSASGIGTSTSQGAARAATAGDAVCAGGALAAGGSYASTGPTGAGNGIASAGGAVLGAVLPDAVLASTNLQDTDLVAPPARLADIADDPDAPDSDWFTAIDPTADTMLRLGLADAAGDLVAAQAFELWLRKTGAGDPTVAVELWEAGSLVAVLVSGVSITSLTGQKLTVPWDPGLVTDPANAELRVVGTAA